MSGSWGWALALAACALAGCGEVAKSERGAAIVRVRAPSRGIFFRAEFSRDGEYVLAWQELATADRSEARRQRPVVFTLPGRPVPEAVDAAGNLAGKFAALFPKTAAEVRYADFAKGSHCCGYSPDLTLGLRVIKGAGWEAELWRMTPKREKLWAVTVPPPMSYGGLVSFQEAPGKASSILVLIDRQVYILARDSGRSLSTFEVAEFPPWVADVDLHHGLLACGSLAGRLITVMSTVAPNRQVFITREPKDGPPTIPGCWLVNRVGFAGGDYLVAESTYSERGGFRPPPRIHLTEILRVTSWEKVWASRHEGIGCVTLSPDGRVMARTHGGNLEILPFIPAPMPPTPHGASGPRPTR